MEEYVHQFCELSYQVPLYDESLFKDLFYFGLNSHIKAMFNKSLFSGGVYKGREDLLLPMHPKHAAVSM